MASSVLASKCNFLVFVTCVLVICDEAIGITTIHHDKPPESRLSISRMPNRVKFNSTIPPGERRKRLLPYYNFYVAQDINQQSKTKPQQYQTINFRPAGNYFLETSPPQKFRTKVPQQLLHNRQKIQLTPFLDSNALAGPFVPIIRKPEQNHGEYQTKQPDYASIYENMSKLKFLPPPESYNNYRVTPQRGEKTRYEGEEVTARPEPVTVKTIIQTYKPTHIDVTSEGERYSQKANLESNGDKGVYRSEMAYQHFSPPVTSEEYKQYRKDQDRYVPDKSKYAQENIRYVDVKAQYAPENLQYAPEKSLNDPDKIQFVPADVRYVKAQYTPEKVQYVPILKYVTSKPQYIPNNLQYHQEQIQYVSGTTEDTQRPNPTLLHHQKLEEVTENPAPIVVTISPRKPYQPSVYKYEPIHSNIQNFQHLTVSTTTPEPSLPQPTELPETSTTKPKTLNLLLKQLQESNTLPQTLTPDNVDNSIKTLVKILDSLKKQQSKFTRPIVVAEEEEYDGENEADGVGVNLGPDVETHSFPAVTQEGGTPGKPGVDYPALSTIPKTSFNCKTQRYKGFFGDPDTNCQVWHYCDLNGGQASFLCPNGTIFSQVALTCDWWFNVKCASTPQLYVLNERLYKYILPLSPKFPEDYSGPLVDKYLALKFQEMEEKMRKEKKGKVQADSEEVSKEEENEEKEISTEEDEYVTTVEAETTK